MGVYQRGNSWIIDFYYDGKRYTESVGPVNRTVAKEKLVIRKREVIQGQYKPKVVQIAFDKFSEEYLKYAKANNRPSSHIRKVDAFKHLKKHFTGKRLLDITSFTIEKYKQDRKGEGAAPATVNRELQSLRHLFNMAVKWGKLQKNPMAEVKLFKEPSGKERILSPEEEGRLLDYVRSRKKSQHLEAIIITALNTGMRKGEILNLRWPQVDLKNKHIVVEETKNGELRKIPMNRRLTDTLKHVKKSAHSQGPYVFADGKKPYGDVKSGFWTALDKCGIENFRFHDLRHTFGSRLGMAGVDIKTIQELMGHKDIKMTMRYSHPTPEHKKHAVEVLDRSHSKIHNITLSKKKAHTATIGNH